VNFSRFERLVPALIVPVTVFPIAMVVVFWLVPSSQSILIGGRIVARDRLVLLGREIHFSVSIKHAVRTPQSAQFHRAMLPLVTLW
jgi:hypothetical protein